MDHMRTISKVVSSAVLFAAICGLSRTASATDYVVILLDNTGSMTTPVGQADVAGQKACPASGICADGNSTVCTTNCPYTRWDTAKKQATNLLVGSGQQLPRGSGTPDRAFAILTFTDTKNGNQNGIYQVWPRVTNDCFVDQNGSVNPTMSNFAGTQMVSLTDPLRIPKMQIDFANTPAPLSCGKAPTTQRTRQATAIPASPLSLQLSPRPRRSLWATQVAWPRSPLPVRRFLCSTPRPRRLRRLGCSNNGALPPASRPLRAVFARS